MANGSGQGSLFGCTRPHTDDKRAEYGARLRNGDISLDERCPCCTRLVKLYPRKLNSQMARFLCRLARLTREQPKKDWFHVREMMPSGAHKASSDGSYLKYWGFVRAKQAAPGEPAAGLYQITQAGRMFANGHRDAARTAFVFAGRPWGLSQERITIYAALGDHFDWQELMGLPR